MATTKATSLTSVTPPPELPGNIPNMSDLLATYLRRFSLWSSRGFSSCLSTQSAAPQLLLQSQSGQNSFALRVDDTPTATLTQLQGGSGADGTVFPIGGSAGVSSFNTRTGAVTLLSSDITAAGGATVAQVPALASGFVNRLRNGTVDVWQRGTASIACPAGTTPTIVADGWGALFTGATGSAQQAAGRGPTLYALQLNGAASVTASSVQQRIESNVAAVLGGTVTFQAQIYNATGASITPTLTIGHAPTQDAFGTSPPADVGPVNLQSCASGAWTQIAYTASVPAASAALGLFAQLNFGAAQNASGKNILVAEADLRLTPGWPVGLCAAPPLPELRPVAHETLICQRYYEQTIGGFGVPTYWSGNVTSGIGYYSSYVSFKAVKRASPTIVFANTGTAQSFPNTSGTLVGTTTAGMLEMRTANATAFGIFSSNWTANAEL